MAITRIKVPLRGAKSAPAQPTKPVVIETDRSKKGLPLKTILRKTPALMRNSAEGIVIKDLVKVKTKAGFPAVKAVCVDPDGSGHPQKVVISSRSLTAKIYDAPKVLVDCSCSNYAFMWEFSLSTWGAAKIKRSNGEPALVTNPSNVPGCCKHLYAVGRCNVRGLPRR
jgi:hypothetical protein